MQDFQDKFEAFLEPFSLAKAKDLPKFAVQSEERHREVISMAVQQSIFAQLRAGLTFDGHSVTLRTPRIDCDVFTD